MQVVKDYLSLRQQIENWKAEGCRIGFVPTMGNLHEGHIALVNQARSAADRVVVSVFVNPTQFGAGEDFSTYPRTFDADYAKLTAAGAQLMFFPALGEIYPFGQESAVSVEVPGLSNILCGEFRPGHFRGVTTVVNRLLNMVSPHMAVFGEKDYQQLFLIRRMVEDLRMPVEILSGPTVREKDGLAMSSRNGYLTAEQRQKAPVIYRVLSDIASEIAGGCRDFRALTVSGRQLLENEGFRPQYLTVRDTRNLLEPDAEAVDKVVILVAAYLGSTRLIDNIVVKLQ